LFGAVGAVFGADGVGYLVEAFARRVLFHGILTFWSGLDIMRLSDYNPFCPKSQAI
jgi:hypothetical protein